MILENREVKLIGKGETIDGVLYFAEESENHIDKVFLKLDYNNESIIKESENFFQALIEIRLVLEKKNIFIQCNGASKCLYPSPMQLSMGVGRRAYINALGKQAKNEDIVDIFDKNDDLEFVSIKEQEEFHQRWIQSFRG